MTTAGTGDTLGDDGADCRPPYSGVTSVAVRRMLFARSTLEASHGVKPKGSAD